MIKMCCHTQVNRPFKSPALCYSVINVCRSKFPLENITTSCDLDSKLTTTAMKYPKLDRSPPIIVRLPQP